MGSSTSTFRSLRHRNARLYFLGLIVSQAGTWLQATAQAWLVLRLSNSGTALGVVVACQFLPLLLLGAWGGVVADRANRRRLVFITQSAAAVQAIVLGVLDLTGTVTVGSVYVLALVLGVITAIDTPARRSFIAELVDADELSNAMSLNTAVMTGSRVFGPAMAGVLIKVVGTGWCFLINGISFAAVLLALVAMDAHGIRRVPPVPHARGQVREGLRHVWADPTMRLTLLLLFVVSTLAWNFQVVVPLFVRRVFGGGAGVFGLLLAVQSVGNVGGSLLAAARHHVTLRFYLATLLAFGVFLTLFAGSPTLAVAFALSVPMGAGGAAFIASSSGLLLDRSRPDMRGRVLSLQSIAFLGSTPIGGPLVGWIGQTYGARWAVAVGGVSALAALVIAVPFAVRAHALEVTGREPAPALGTSPAA